MERNFDVVIAGGGILGTALAFWLSSLYEGKIAVLEMEQDVAMQTSGRNTGVIHRPFYLNPERRKIFARSAQISYGLWKKYAEIKGLPWSEVGTIEVACGADEVKIVEKYMKWALQNGMGDEEVAFLSAEEVRKIEPRVQCEAAIFSKTDTSTDFKSFTRALKEDAVSQGAEFIFNFELAQVRDSGGGLSLASKDGSSIQTQFFINAAGGNAVDIAHALGLGREYADIHFRGEYWELSNEVADWTARNIYSVPRHPELPFLDPHWIVRADGRREIGPNAVMVAGSRTYKGFFSGIGELVGKIFEPPMKNKIKLFTNPEFIKLASEEWMSSISKGRMVKGVQKFIPDLKESHCLKRGTAGIRSSVIDAGGNFVKEAIPLWGKNSFHILNYNSPGATGSPAYTALLVNLLERKGALAGLKKRPRQIDLIWSHSSIIERMDSAESQISA